MRHSGTRVRRSADRHDMMYHRVLDAFGEKGCPICSLRNEAIHRYLDSVLYEHVNDPELRKTLIQSRGFCRDHAWALSRRGDSLGVAILYKDQVQEALAQIQRIGTEIGGMGRRNLWRGNRTSSQTPAGVLRRLRTPEDPCPACRIGAEAQQRYLSTLMTHLNDPEIRKAIDGSSFLCIPDLLVALEFSRTHAQARSLLEVIVSKLKHLDGELEELVRKRDYRFLNEPRGEEQTSWWRAIRQLVGWPEARAPWSA